MIRETAMSSYKVKAKTLLKDFLKLSSQGDRKGGAWQRRRRFIESQKSNTEGSRPGLKQCACDRIRQRRRSWNRDSKSTFQGRCKEFRGLPRFEKFGGGKSEDWCRVAGRRVKPKRGERKTQKSKKQTWLWKAVKWHLSTGQPWI